MDWRVSTINEKDENMKRQKKDFLVRASCDVVVSDDDGIFYILQNGFYVYFNWCF